MQYMPMVHCSGFLEELCLSEGRKYAPSVLDNGNCQARAPEGMEGASALASALGIWQSFLRRRKAQVIIFKNIADTQHS